MSKRFLSSCLLASLALANLFSSANAEWESQVGIELQAFTESSNSANTFNDENWALSFESEYHGRLGDSDWQTTLIPFARWDNNDDERKHLDLREAHVLKAVDSWVFQIGLAKVFWGVTESQHLVDVINQTDNLEGLDGEDKLGQPLIRLGYEFEQAAIDLYVLPSFREREFLSFGNRFGPPPLTDFSLFESSQGRDHIDYALRWSGYRGPVDFGLSYFSGTARTPTFVPANQTASLFSPFYAQTQRAGLELQYTGDAWLWKLEALHQEVTSQGQKEQSNAAVLGFEYTIFGLQDGLLDLGLLAEYNLDSRDDPARVFLQNDLFAAMRLSFNDAEGSAILAGAFVDLDDDTTAFRMEGSRRIGDNITIELEMQVFSDSEVGNIARNLAENDFIKLEIKRYF